jgi:hypothetical protein
MECALREAESSKRNAIPGRPPARRRGDPPFGVLAGISPIIVAIAQ